jgi:hypothetical protein
LTLPKVTGRHVVMRFEILSELSDMDTFAAGSDIREIARLRRISGRA